LYDRRRRFFSTPQQQNFYTYGNSIAQSENSIAQSEISIAQSEIFVATV
jgi:hypothetical protein